MVRHNTTLTLNRYWFGEKKKGKNGRQRKGRNLANSKLANIVSRLGGRRKLTKQKRKGLTGRKKNSCRLE